MSGEHKNYDNDDFLDDFVLDEGLLDAEPDAERDTELVEPVSASSESAEPQAGEPGHATSADHGAVSESQFLEDLLATGEAASPPASRHRLQDLFAGADASVTGDDGPERPEEELLFAAQAEDAATSETFTSDQEFSEAGESTWSGQDLELDREPEPEEQDQSATSRSYELDLVLDDEDEVNAEVESFLGDAVLGAEDDFELDSEQELEIVDETLDAASGSDGGKELDGIMIADEELAFGAETSAGAAAEEELDAIPAEFLDEAEDVEEGMEAAAEVATRGPEPTAETADSEYTEDSEYEEEQVDYIGELADAATADAAVLQEGWEPLPGAEMGALADVEELATTDADSSGPETGYGDWEDEDHAASADYDIYADAHDDGTEVVGTYRPRGRTLSMFAAVAASFLVVGTVALGVWRPQWFGLARTPGQVEQVQVQRPLVRVSVGAPAMPVAEAVEVVPVDPQPPRVVVTEPPPVEPSTGTPGAGTDPSSQPGEGGGQVAVTEPAPKTEPDEPRTTGGEPVVEVPVVPVATVNELQWPVTPVAEPASQGPEPLLRAGGNLLLGGAAPLPTPVSLAGVTPGLRAFAQLENGNYFIGSVKAVDSEFLTLRTQTGEISLPRSSLTALTELGSADYEQLQQATTGFVRLTNRNRLVGNILKSIADDHVVLETRSNRVMLPKSAIGEIVEDGGGHDVKLGTTAAEEDWLRKVSARQIGSPLPGTAAAAQPAGGAAPGK